MKRKLEFLVLVEFRQIRKVVRFHMTSSQHRDHMTLPCSHDWHQLWSWYMPPYQYSLLPENSHKPCKAVFLRFRNLLETNILFWRQTFQLLYQLKLKYSVNKLFSICSKQFLALIHPSRIQNNCYTKNISWHNYTCNLI